MTAKEFIKKKDEETGTMWTEDDDEIAKVLIEFAKYHAQEASKAAADNSRKMSSSYNTILTSYPLENIK